MLDVHSSDPVESSGVVSSAPLVSSSVPLLSSSVPIESSVPLASSGAESSSVLVVSGESSVSLPPSITVSSGVASSAAEINVPTNDDALDDDEELELLVAGKKFSCPVCHRAYASFGNLKRHQDKECVGSVAKHACELCEYKSRQSGNLFTHYRKNHPEHDFSHRRTRRTQVDADQPAVRQADQ